MPSDRVESVGGRERQPVAWMIRTVADARWRVYDSQLVAEKDLVHLNASPELTEAQPFRVVPLYEHPLDVLSVLAAQAKRTAGRCLSPSNCDYASHGWCPRCEPVR